VLVSYRCITLIHTLRPPRQAHKMAQRQIRVIEQRREGSLLGSALAPQASFSRPIPALWSVCCNRDAPRGLRGQGPPDITRRARTGTRKPPGTLDPRYAVSHSPSPSIFQDLDPQTRNPIVHSEQPVRYWGTGEHVPESACRSPSRTAWQRYTPSEGGCRLVGCAYISACSPRADTCCSSKVRIMQPVFSQ
jgi:hypothetical protein